MRYSTNRYPGVNAHLNSYLLAKGKWQNFYTEMIIQLRRQLDKILPGNYYAMGEDGLQLNFIDDDEIESSYVRPDVGILQSNPVQNPAYQDKTKPAFSIPFKELAELDVEEALRRVGIYEFVSDVTEGRLVSTIEVLSPANKPHGSNLS